MKLLVIYNPHAGGGRAAKLLLQIQDYLKQQNLDFDLWQTKHIGHAVELVVGADLSQYDGLVASGGDGTLFEVLNGLMKNPGLVKPPIGLIPNGTGNAFMKELKLQKDDWKTSIDIINNAQPKRLDIGQLLTEGKKYYFLNIVGMGFVSEVAQAAIPLKWMGNASYTAATLQKLINLKAQPITLEVDGKTLERQGVFVEVANSTYTGTSFFMAPKAKLDDGLLDVVLLKEISRLRLLKLFTSIYDGSHIEYPEIEYIQAKKIKIIESHPSTLIPDGEIMGQTPAEFECIGGAIEFFWPHI
ncbi:MAG: diacylglycerol kinase family lipid kinase [Kangiellaceae bacterium]|nr:diacylglycerol kinase family lipid kinase [Kangiellaceae bacterium]